ncbi:MAG TPA: outer membrane beta-barrel protein [Candidatus Coprenecus avistercoris]|uniref:Outer membrane beta-barrel protein n=1 Tax=Candidatus Coprenecus avistercoris TaxID=2840730 RepID=A0A9D1DZS2_9BACT|nr:outer membrane beta-barrel protein [Candidatus Coprenecus avistercoris]
MKRLYIILFSLLVLSYADARAQFMKFSLGMELGGSFLMHMPPQEDIIYSGGAQGGLFMDLYFGRYLGVSGTAQYAFQIFNHNLGSDLTATTMQHYLQVPVMLQVRTCRVLTVEAGIMQSILVASQYQESAGDNTGFTANPDPGAAKYILSAAAALKINLGKSVYLTLRGTYGLSQAYNYFGQGAIPVSVQMGLGFRFYTFRKSAFKL